MEVRSKQSFTYKNKQVSLQYEIRIHELFHDSIYIKNQKLKTASQICSASVYLCIHVKENNCI
jgi:hypothetical protein